MKKLSQQYCGFAEYAKCVIFDVFLLHNLALGGRCVADARGQTCKARTVYSMHTIGEAWSAKWITLACLARYLRKLLRKRVDQR